MSGSTVGGIVGGVIGFVVSGFNPVGFQIGFMVGSAVGGYLDPTVVKGPKLNDAQTQTSMEGVPRPIVYGTACVAGNIIQVGPLVEHKHRERQGKGGGPVQETYTYTRTVAIRICEAAPLGGEMKLRRVWMDDKLVYDVSAPEATHVADGTLRSVFEAMAIARANSTKFASILTFYSGSETQLPDPTLEALPAEYGGGVGNVPAYRGTCYAVLANLDVTDRQGSVPQFRWEVCSDADSTNASQDYDALDFDGGKPWRDDALSVRDPRRPGVTYEYAAMSSGSDDYNLATWRATVDEALADAATAMGYSAIGGTELMGWTGTYGGFNPGTPIAPWEDASATAWASSYVLGLCYARYPGDTAVVSTPIFEAGGPTSGTGACGYYPDPVWAARLVGNNTGSFLNQRHFTIQQSSVAPAGNDGGFSCYDGATFHSGLSRYSGYVIACRPVLGCYHNPPDGARELPDAPGFYLVDGEVVDYSQTCATVTGTFKQLSLLERDSSPLLGAAGLLAFPLGPALPSTDPNYSTQAYWDDAYAQAAAAGLMPAGMTYSATGTGGYTTYPRLTTQACQCSTALGTVSPNFAPLDEVVADIADRGNVRALEIDVTALEGQPVRGLALASQMAAADAIRELQKVKFFDMPEWGDNGDVGTKLRAVPRGGSVAVTLSDDDLVAGDEDEEVRAQQVEFPRKVHLIAQDPNANYEPATETFERVSENVKATGELTLNTAVVMTRDEAAQTVDVIGMVAWEEALGSKTLEVPEAFSIYTPGDIVQYGKRWRLTNVEAQDGQSKWSLARDRARAYVSTASGSQVLIPAPPSPPLRGPTILQILNLPSLRPTDAVPGVYLAACGLMNGWRGADIYLQIDGVETRVATITQPAIMGKLTDAIGTSGEPLSIQLYNDDELDSASSAQIAAGANRFAITADDTSEVGQFRTPTDTGVQTFDLSDLSRGVLSTTVTSHSANDAWCLLDASVVFLPLDIDLAGQTLTFRAVSRGTAPANNPTQTFVFRPQFTSLPAIDFYETDIGEVYTTEDGTYYELN